MPFLIKIVGKDLILYLLLFYTDTMSSHVATDIFTLIEHSCCFLSLISSSVKLVSQVLALILFGKRFAFKFCEINTICPFRNHINYKVRGWKFFLGVCSV